MVDTLRCDEVMSPMRHSTPIIAAVVGVASSSAMTSYHERLPSFCKAYKDRAILNDHRVFRNLLDVERCYKTSLEHYQSLQVTNPSADYSTIWQSRLVAEMSFFVQL